MSVLTCTVYTDFLLHSIHTFMHLMLSIILCRDRQQINDNGFVIDNNSFSKIITKTKKSSSILILLCSLFPCGSCRFYYTIGEITPACAPAIRSLPPFLMYISGFFFFFYLLLKKKKRGWSRTNFLPLLDRTISLEYGLLLTKKYSGAKMWWDILTLHTCTY